MVVGTTWFNNSQTQAHPDACFVQLSFHSCRVQHIDLLWLAVLLWGSREGGTGILRWLLETFLFVAQHRSRDAGPDKVLSEGWRYAE